MSNPEPTSASVSEAASLLGRKGKGVRKSLTPEQREAKRERMRLINAERRKVKP